MKITTQQAVRALTRVWQPINERLEEGAWADRQFDGGEFSGPANANAWHEAWEQTVARVAAQLGLTAQELEDASYAASEHELYCFQRSHLPGWHNKGNDNG